MKKTTLKNIQLKSSSARVGQIFFLIVELENDKGETRRCVVDLIKGLRQDDVVEKLTKDLARQITD